MGLGDIKTAEGAGARAFTGVRERLKRHLSAVLDLYSPLTLLELEKDGKIKKKRKKKGFLVIIDIHATNYIETCPFLTK